MTGQVQGKRTIHPSDKPRGAPLSTDAIVLLKDDHKQIRQVFNAVIV